MSDSERGYVPSSSSKDDANLKPGAKEYNAKSGKPEMHGPHEPPGLRPRSRSEEPLVGAKQTVGGHVVVCHFWEKWGAEVRGNFCSPAISAPENCGVECCSSGEFEKK